MWFGSPDGSSSECRVHDRRMVNGGRSKAIHWEGRRWARVRREDETACGEVGMQRKRERQALYQMT